MPTISSVRIKYQTARNGETTIVVNDRHLHSRYNPHREASRFIESITLDHREGSVILVGDGTGVVRSLFEDKHPRARVVALSPVIEGDAGTAPRLTTPSEGAVAIRTALHPLDVATVQLVTWPNAEAALPDWTSALHAIVLATIREMQAELATVGSFGRLWLTNGLRRSITLEDHKAVRFSGDGMLCAAAGPSLEGLLHDIPIGKRSRLALISASSALHWLEHHHFQPVLAVHTDGGMWARRYTIDAVRPDTIIALPLRASSVRTVSVLPVSTGWIGEHLAPDSNRWMRLPEAPTVGATLLDLAHVLAPEVPVVVSGLDLCSRDLLSHARPHRNDRFIAAQTSRLRPEETIRATRAGLREPAPDTRSLRWHDGTNAWQTATLRLYRDCVSAAIDRHRRNAPVVFHTPSPVWEDERNRAGQQPWPTGSFKVDTVIRPPRRERIDHANRCMKRWREEIAAFGGGASRAPLSRELLDLVLHLAPVEALQWSRGTLPWEKVRERCCVGLNAMLRRLEYR